MSKDKNSMSNGLEASTDAREGGQRVFDLGERTARFAEEVIGFVRTVAQDAVTVPLIRQLVRSATSVGANYCEADTAGTKKEFRYRISLCLRESKETAFWLRMLGKTCPLKIETARRFWKEANELTRIFASIQRKTQPG